MCPTEERDERTREGTVHVLEISAELQNSMIKRYQRSSADIDIFRCDSDIRTPITLYNTVKYIEREIINFQFHKNAKNVQLLSAFIFVWDRFRMVLKDFTLQYRGDTILDTNWIVSFECIVRWHIWVHHWMLRTHEFDVAHSHQNHDSLINAIQALMGHYMMLSWKCQFIDTDNLRRHEHMNEVVSYYLLLHINDSATFLRILRLLPYSEVNGSSAIQDVVFLKAQMRSNNYIQFFRWLRRTSPFKASLAHSYVQKMRHIAIRSIAQGYLKASRFPLSKFMEMLCFCREEDVQLFLEEYGLSISTDESPPDPSVDRDASVVQKYFVIDKAKVIEAITSGATFSTRAEFMDEIIDSRLIHLRPSDICEGNLDAEGP